MSFGFAPSGQIAHRGNIQGRRSNGQILLSSITVIDFGGYEIIPMTIALPNAVLP